MKKGFYTIQAKSMSDFGVTTQKDLWEKVKAEGYRGMSVNAKTVFEVKEVGDKKVYHATFSSANMDRHGEIVMQVFDLSGFINNPVYLDSHNYDSIEHIIGRIHNINTNGGGLNGDVEFCLDNPKGALAEKMVAGGFLNTSSIGFIPTNFDNDGNILASELLEISAVSVPANADALFEKGVEAKKEGDECEMDDGSMGEMKPDKDGNMVCKIKEVKEEKAIVGMEIAPKKKSVAEVVAKIAEEKQKTYELMVKLSKELILDGKKECARNMFQIVRELSK